MTPQEAIETIKIAIAEVEWNYPMNYAVAFEKAIEALEKQMPKKPTIYCANWCKDTKVYKCSCGAFSINAHKYCRKCGQLTDWSDTE